METISPTVEMHEPAVTPVVPASASVAKQGMNMKLIIGGLAVVIVLLLAIVGGLALAAMNAANQPTTANTPNPVPNPAATGGNSADLETLNPNASPTPAPTPNPAPPAATTTKVENAYLTIQVPTGWTATQTPGGAVNIISGNYILYINPYYQQASGVQGGRFSEISGGAPSADAVMKVQPSDPCGTKVDTNLGSTKVLHAFFVGPSDVNDQCGGPSSGAKVWYFTYVNEMNTGGHQNGYINYYNSLYPKGWVITMAYNSKNPDVFPRQDSVELTTKLTEMANITNSLVLKNN